MPTTWPRILGEAHATLGWVRMAHTWDWSSAEQSYQRAIALSPEYASAHQWYGVYLLFIADRPVEALEKFAIAEQLDPLSPIIRSNTVQALRMLGRLDEAMVAVDGLIAAHPDFYLAYERKSEVYIHMGRLDEAIAARERSVEVAAGQVKQLGSLAAAYANLGRADDARAILAELTSASQEQYVAPLLFASIHAGLGEYEQAFTWLERAVEEQSFDFAITIGRPDATPLDSFAAMRADPRFQDLVRRLALPTR